MWEKVKKSSKGLSEKGFTVIEVMLVLAITGLLLVGVLGSSFGSIQFQRYEDSVNSFAESLRNVYNEVLNPRSDQGGNSNTAMYGKVISFDGGGGESFFTVTLVGYTTPPKTETSFMHALSDVNIQPSCASWNKHTVSWGSRIYHVSGDTHEANDTETGAVLIARSPISGTIHTVYTNRTYSLGSSSICENYTSDIYRSSFADGVKNMADGTDPKYTYSMDKDINFCIRSEDNDEIPRVVQIKADGSNTSAVTILDESESAALGCQLQMSEGGGPDGP